jgi:DSF synthase
MRGRSKTARRQDRETPDGALRSKFELRKAAALVSLRRDIVVEAPVNARADQIQNRWRARLKGFAELRVNFDPATGILWSYMDPRGRPCVTPGMVREGRDLQTSVKTLFEELTPSGIKPVRYMVWGSQCPDVFNLGGDLKLFAQLIRDRDRDGLLDYATACIDVVHGNIVSLDLPIITISLVQGDALGGGFEKALSTNVLVAERGTKFGLPEVLFNLFPGMGAYSLLARRIGEAQAKRMILSGRIYTAEMLHEMGLVDVLAEPGQGRQAVCDYTSRYTRRHSAECAINRASRRVNPVTYEELEDIAVMWVDTALGLSDTDLRKMERLAAAQERRRRLSSEAGAASG